MRRVHLPKRCPHPPHLAIVPSGFTKRELDPVPAISTTPPFMQSYTSQVLHPLGDGLEKKNVAL